MEILSILAVLILVWMAWQLWRAKQFTQFKQELMLSIKPKVLSHLEQSLIEQRSTLTPNNDCHIQASQYYWGLYPSRVLQYALQHELLTTEQLKQEGKYRYCQHLFHIEAGKLHHFQEALAN